jgi:phosphate-selective porin
MTSLLTAGLNWYLGPNMRIMLNCVLREREHVGDAEALMLRFQVNF